MKLAVVVCVVGLTALTTTAPSDQVKRQAYSSRYPSSPSASAPTPDSASSASSSGRRASSPSSSFGARSSSVGSFRNSITATQNPFLAGTRASGDDPNTYYLTGREAIKLVSGFLPILTEKLTKESNNTAAETMRDITLSFLPLARDVVESRSRNINSDDMGKLEAAEEFVPALMNAVVDYVDSFDIPSADARDDTLADYPQFDLEDPTAILDNIPRIVIRD